jgi:dihydroneopterin aldolase
VSNLLLALHAASLRDCRRLFLRDHELPVRIGVHDFEQRGPQRLRINVELWVPLAQSTPSRDRLEEVVDYDFVRGVIAERVGRGPIGLQETLADELLATLLAHPQVRAARVRTEKPDVYPDCAAVGVEVYGLNPATDRIPNEAPR